MVMRVSLPVRFLKSGSKILLMAFVLGLFLPKALANPLPIETKSGRSVLVANPYSSQGKAGIHVGGYIARKHNQQGSVLGAHLRVEIIGANGAVLGTKILPVDSIKVGNFTKGYPQAVPFTVDFPSYASATEISIVYEGKKS